MFANDLDPAGQVGAPRRADSDVARVDQRDVAKFGHGVAGEVCVTTDAGDDSDEVVAARGRKVVDRYSPYATWRTWPRAESLPQLDDRDAQLAGVGRSDGAVLADRRLPCPLLAGPSLRRPAVPGVRVARRSNSSSCGGAASTAEPVHGDAGLIGGRSGGQRALRLLLVPFGLSLLFERLSCLLAGGTLW